MLQEFLHLTSTSVPIDFWFALLFTLAATVGSFSRTSKVWGRAAVLIAPVSHSQSWSSHVWRWCRMVQGLSLDYG